MEHLKSGDVPALVTNIEVMNILSKRITTRKEEEEAATQLKDGSSNINIGTSKSKHTKLRHRDYIEQSVYEYLTYTPCANVDVTTLPELVKKLKGKRKIKKNEENEEQKQQQNQGGNINKMIKTEEAPIEVAVQPPLPISETEQMEDENYSDVNHDKYGLTDAETLQILNHMPTEQVDIHLMIEDLPSRLDEDEQTKLLELIAQHAGTEEVEETEELEDLEENGEVDDAQN